jgi:nucleolar GTP-binding protein
VYFEKLKTVPTAEELLDRSLRRAAKKMREKQNKDRANEEFVRAVAASLHDRLVQIIRDFPVIEELPPFYQDMVAILFGINRYKKAMGAVGWAAWNTRLLGSRLGKEIRKAPDTAAVRKQAVARISSMLHQIDDQLHFLNEARNILRKLPEIRDEFTVVVAGYPNVGKSSFIRRVSTAEPEIAEYPFTTKGIILGHRREKRSSTQFLDTPGLLSRPMEERNPIEQQAINALMHVADVILFLLDPSGSCGYPLAEQKQLLAEVEGMAPVPVLAVVNKKDWQELEGYPNMSTLTGEGVEEVLQQVLTYRESSPMHRTGRSPPETP